MGVTAILALPQRCGATRKGYEMKQYNVLKPVYFDAGLMLGFLGNKMPAFGIAWKTVGVVSAETPEDALVQAKKILVAPVLEVQL